MANSSNITPAHWIDLHSHSTASDGTMPPREVVRRAARAGLVGFSLTDHDTVAGIADAADEAAALRITFIPGIEISCMYPDPGIMHLLGYGFDPRHPEMASLAAHLVANRNDRNPRIIARLNEVGVHITLDEVRAEAGGDVISRVHIAAVLIRKGYVSSVQQAFAKYLAPGGLAYFEKDTLTQRQAIERIKSAGGLAVLAHPVQLKTENDAQLGRIVKDLLDLGLDGIEVIHSDHSPALVEKYAALADRYGLLKTGGSDYHGRNKTGVELGIANGRRIPRAYLDAMLERLGKQDIHHT